MDEMGNLQSKGFPKGFKGKRFWVAVTILVLVLLVVWDRYALPSEFVPYEDFNEFLTEVGDSDREINWYTENLKKAYTEDTYGGATPEETLDMFIAALGAKDVALASKYFVIEKQARMLGELSAGLESGGVETFLDIYKMGGDGDYIDESNFQHSIFIDDIPMNLNLIKNTYSGVWKIESL